MSSTSETIHAVQKAAEPYIKSRDEVSHIRRILAAHLATGLDAESTKAPLALAEPSSSAALSHEMRGLQREYFRALEANFKARGEFDRVRKQHARGPVSTALWESEPSDPLEDHLVAIRLQKKCQRLQAVNKYLKLLSQKPAAAETFLDPEDIFKDAASLPEVPRAVMDGFVADRETEKTDLKELINRLEKAVLRAKLLLKREEHLLEQAKTRAEPLPELISDAARLQALSASRSELIAWMENELGKVSGEDSNEANESSSRGDGTTERAHMDDQLADIKQKYAKYVAARKSLVQAVSQSPQPAMAPPAEVHDHSAPPSRHAPRPTTYLLLPYLEGLLSVAHEQKGLITQKAHLNVALTKQLKDSCQTVDYLTHESQLLPTHPISGSVRRRAGIGDGLSTAESYDVSSRLKDWVFAADSAKIATLEAVAEKIEEGQVALEGTMKVLGEIDQLVGTRAQQAGDLGPDTAEEDIWLAQEQSRKDTKPARHVDRGGSQVAKDSDIWSVLEGSLGLIRAEDDHT